MMGRTVGAGQVYLESQKDSTGAWLDGGKDYTLHVPKDAPVAQFWSFTVYDNESRCLIDTGSYPDRSSRDDISKNADGSVDLYFGPEPPVGKPEKNWIKTLLGKGWFTYFRLYGPTEAYFASRNASLTFVSAEVRSRTFVSNCSLVWLSSALALSSLLCASRLKIFRMPEIKYAARSAPTVRKS
jgi:hypothetical protein